LSSVIVCHFNNREWGLVSDKIKYDAVRYTGQVGPY